MVLLPRKASLVAFAALFVSVLACGGGDEPAAGGGQGPPPTAVRTITVAPAPLESVTETTGLIDALQSIELRAETSGQVVRVGFEDGQAVEKGDVLVSLRDEAPRAEVARAEAQLGLATSRYERTRALFERQNASQQELDQATAERDLAQASLASAREQLRRTVIRAPFAGVTGLREVDVGDWVDASRRITRLDDLSAVTVDVDLPERMAGVLALGAGVRVRVDAWPDAPFDGAVTYVAPRADAVTHTLRVRARVHNPDGRLRPGMSARVDVVTGSSARAMLVPTEAVMSTGEGPAVFVVGADDKAERRLVKTGVRLARRVEIVEGLQPGDRVITEGLVRLAPGGKIRVLGESATGTADDPTVETPPERAQAERQGTGG